MRDTMRYKGYEGSVEWSKDDGCYFGKVLWIESLLMYEGKDEKELFEDFTGLIDDYLAACEAENVPVEKPNKGSFHVCISPDLVEDVCFL